MTALLTLACLVLIAGWALYGRNKNRELQALGRERAQLSTQLSEERARRGQYELFIQCFVDQPMVDKEVKARAQALRSVQQEHGIPEGQQVEQIERIRADLREKEPREAFMTACRVAQACGFEANENLEDHLQTEGATTGAA